MNLFRSLCCAFGGRCAEEPKPTKENTQGEVPASDLGQTEAELEKEGKERMGHLEGEGGKTAPRQSSRSTK